MLVKNLLVVRQAPLLRLWNKLLRNNKNGTGKIIMALKQLNLLPAYVVIIFLPHKVWPPKKVAAHFIVAGNIIAGFCLQI